MTISEAHQEFKLRLDKLDSLNYPDILPEEIDSFLNNAQEVFIKDRYGITNTKRQSFEETQKRAEDLKNVVVNYITTPLAHNSSNIDDNAQYVNLPEDHWFIVEDRAKITYKDCNGKNITERVRIEAINHDEFANVIDNPFKKPSTTRLVKLMTNGNLELIHSPDVTINEYHLRYIKQPNKVSLDDNITFELSEHTHSEIIDISISLVLENIESKRLVTQKQFVKDLNE